MKKICCFVLAVVMLLSAIPSYVLAANMDTKEAVLLDLDDHVEVIGEEPVYPEAPDEYTSYDDYRDSTGYVHDTEFYYDQEEKLWYYYVTNSSEIWSSANLVNWTKEETDRSGNAWAPCIIKLRQPVQFEGETYTYALWDSLSTFGTRESWIRLWLSDSPKEGFVYAGDTVTSLLDDGRTHNAIDPSVFYDQDGTMWMIYGSFFGGMFMIELDQETLMPVNPDEIPGKRMVYRSQYLNSIEGPTIIYNPDTEYYYLNVSYGSLDHTYNVRIGRSKNVEGPYYDYNGMPLDNEGYTYDQTNQIGTKITTPYSFDNDKGWYSTGHSSFLYNPDTGEYFLSHNARQETIRNTRLNIRKIYWTEDGWPVVSPELYTEGEIEQTIPTRCIPGTYEFIEMFRDDLSTEPLSAVKRTSSKIQLHADHTITGTYEGTWIQTGDNTLKLALGDAVYTVTVAAAWDWENWKECLVFTGLSEAAETENEVFTNLRSGLGIWGKKVDVETEILVDFSFDDKESGFESEHAVADGFYSIQSYDGGNALYLDGTGDYLEVEGRDGSNILAGLEELTVTMKLYPDSTHNTNWPFFAATNADPQPYLNEEYLGILDRGSSIDVERFNNNGSRPAIAYGEKTIDDWYYLTVVFKPNETIIYVDGQELARERSNYQLSDILTEDGIFYIGRANWNEGEYYKGLIDDYMVIGRGLDSQEVAALYEGTTNPRIVSLKVTPPEKTEYIVGEQLKLSGIHVIAQYNTLKTVDVTDDCEIIGYDKDSVGTQTITVSYEGVKTTFTVTVKEKEPDLPELPYVDVTENDWFYEAVAYTYHKELMTGMDATHFGPYGQLSRAQFALILYRMLPEHTVTDVQSTENQGMEGETPVKTKNTFGDIVGDEWYGPAVLWAAENGIVTGYQNGNFGPADMITREQMAVMMYRYAKYLGQDVSVDGDYSVFTDATDVSAFASEAVSWAVGNGIVTGKENGTKIDPQGNTARSEAAIIIQRFMEE